MEKLTNHDSERMTLSCALVDGYMPDRTAGSLQRALALLKPEDFDDARHGAIWKTMQALQAAGSPIEGSTVKAELERASEWESIGWDYFFEILDMAPTSTSLLFHATNVRDHSNRRRLRSAGLELSSAAGRPDLGSTSELIARTEGALREIPRSVGGLPGKTLGELVREYFTLKPEDIRTLKTGFDDLDFYTHGLWPGQLVTIAARPGLGKTVLAMNLAVRAAAKDLRVLFFSLEMTREELNHRILAAESSVHLDTVRAATATGYDSDRIARAAEKIAPYDLTIFDKATQAKDDIFETARSRHAERAVGLVVVDYLQLVQVPGNDTRAQEIADVTRAMKQLAKDLGCPVVALSQLNRNAERDERPPRLADLRESGAIEQDSDVVLLIHRPDPKDDTQRDIIIAKQRNGPTGTFTLAFNGKFCRFENLVFKPLE